MAPSRKRNRDDMADSDSEEENLGRQVLPVANLPENFSAEPMDGMQYLFTVRRDARKLPMVSFVNNPFSTPAVLPEPGSIPETILDGTHPSLPSEEWRSGYISRFRHFRKNSTQPTIGVGPSVPARTKILPDKKERDRWWAFIAGKPEAEWNPPPKPKKEKRSQYKSRDRDRFQSGMRGWQDGDVVETQRVAEEEEEGVLQETYALNEEGEVELVVTEVEQQPDPETSLPTPNLTPHPEGVDTNMLPRHDLSASSSSTSQVGPRQPTPALLRLMDNKYCLHILMYFGHWINEYLQHHKPTHRITITHARWVFALLSRVDDHLSSDEIHTLRVLARRFIALLGDASDSGSGPEEGEEGHSQDLEAPISRGACWMTITTIADFWGQKDLWMDAESALQSLP